MLIDLLVIKRQLCWNQPCSAGSYC